MEKGKTGTIVWMIHERGEEGNGEMAKWGLGMY